MTRRDDGIAGPPFSKYSADCWRSRTPPWQTGRSRRTGTCLRRTAACALLGLVGPRALRSSPINAATALSRVITKSLATNATPPPTPSPQSNSDGRLPNWLPTGTHGGGTPANVHAPCARSATWSVSTRAVNGMEEVGRIFCSRACAQVGARPPYASSAGVSVLALAVRRG